jgi:hypothetical protein
LDWGAATPFSVIGQPVLGAGHEPKLDWHTISSGYFQSLRIPLLQSPIGQQVAIGDAGHRNIYTVVGIVPHLRYNRPDYPQRAFQAYFPYTQTNGRDEVLLLRTASNPASLITPVRKLIASIDPNLPVTRIKPLNDAIAKVYAPERIASYVICLFSGVVSQKLERQAIRHGEKESASIFRPVGRN